jgi:hypothetical protein
MLNIPLASLLWPYESKRITWPRLLTHCYATFNLSDYAAFKCIFLDSCLPETVNFVGSCIQFAGGFSQTLYFLAGCVVSPYEPFQGISWEYYPIRPALPTYVAEFGKFTWTMTVSAKMETYKEIKVLSPGPCLGHCNILEMLPQSHFLSLPVPCCRPMALYECWRPWQLSSPP